MSVRNEISRRGPNRLFPQHTQTGLYDSSVPFLLVLNFTDPKRMEEKVSYPQEWPGYDFNPDHKRQTLLVKIWTGQLTVLSWLVKWTIHPSRITCEPSAFRLVCFTDWTTRINGMLLLVGLHVQNTNLFAILLYWRRALQMRIVI